MQRKKGQILSVVLLQCILPNESFQLDLHMINTIMKLLVLNQNHLMIINII